MKSRRRRITRNICEINTTRQDARLVWNAHPDQGGGCRRDRYLDSSRAGGDDIRRQAINDTCICSIEEIMFADKLVNSSDKLVNSSQNTELHR